MTTPSTPARAPTRRLRSVLVSSALFAAFGCLSMLVVRGETLSLDQWLMLQLHRGTGHDLTAVMRFVSVLGGGGVTAPVMALAAWWAVMRGERRGAVLAIATYLVVLLNQPFKQLFERPRPQLWEHLSSIGGLSYPSGHAMSSAALVAALIVLLHRTRRRQLAALALVAFAVLVGISRVYLGVHYPSDVLGSWLFVAAWAALIRFLVGTLEPLAPEEALREH